MAQSVLVAEDERNLVEALSFLMRRAGYEVSVTRYFYQPQPLRTLEEIRADILALEKETEGLLGEIIGGPSQ